MRAVPPCGYAEALEAAVYQSSRYITDRFLPDKAIDLVDEAGARAKLRSGLRRVRRDQQEHPRCRRADGERGLLKRTSSGHSTASKKSARENLQFVRESSK